MLPFSLLVLSSILSGCACFILGAHMTYNRGYTDGLDDGLSYIPEEDDIASIRWQITPESRDQSPEARQDTAL